VRSRGRCAHPNPDPNPNPNPDPDPDPGPNPMQVHFFPCITDAQKLKAQFQAKGCAKL
jgi:hypothetical protein